MIALRRRLLPEADRNRYVAGSAFDLGWMDQLAAAGGDSVLVVAEAVLRYFEEALVRGLIVALRRRFPGAELVTDVCTPLAVRLDNLHLLVTGSKARMRCAVGDPRELEAWGPGIRLVESFPYFGDPEPRMGLPSWFGRIPPLNRATTIQRFNLGPPPREAWTSGPPP